MDGNISCDWLTESITQTLGAAGTVISGTNQTHTVALNTEDRAQFHTASAESLSENDHASFTQTMDGVEVLGYGGTVTGGSDSYTWDQYVSDPMTLMMSGGVGSPTAEIYDLNENDTIYQSMHDVGSDLLGPSDSILAGSDSYTKVENRYQSSGVTDHGNASHGYSIYTNSSDSDLSNDQGTTSLAGQFSQSTDSYTHLEAASNFLHVESSSLSSSNGGYNQIAVRGDASDDYSNEDTGTISDHNGSHYQNDGFTLANHHGLIFHVTGDVVDSTSSDHFLDTEIDNSMLDANGTTGTTTQNYNFTQGEATTDNSDGTLDTSGTVVEHATNYASNTHTDVETGSVQGVNGELFNQAESDYTSSRNGFDAVQTTSEGVFASGAFNTNSLSTGEVSSGQPYSATEMQYGSYSTMTAYPSPDPESPRGLNSGSGSAMENLGDGSQSMGHYGGAVAYLGRETTSSGDRSNGLYSALGARGANTAHVGKEIQVAPKMVNGITSLYINNGSNASQWSAAPSQPGYRRPGSPPTHQDVEGGGGVSPLIGMTAPDNLAMDTPSGTSGQGGDIATGASSPTQAPQDQTPIQPSPIPQGQSLAGKLWSGVTDYTSEVGQILIAEVRGAAGVVVEGVHIGADILRGEEQRIRNVTGIGGEVEYQSNLFKGYLAAADQSPEAADKFQLNAFFDMATVGIKPLIQAGMKSFDENDPIPFAEAFGGFAVGVVGIKAALKGELAAPEMDLVDGIPRSDIPAMSRTPNDSGISLGETPNNTFPIYRKMSAAEAAKTLETNELQPKMEGTDQNGKRYLSESLTKVKKFENKQVPVGTVEVIVEFAMDKAKYDALLDDKVLQKMVGKTPGGKSKIEYHYEGLIDNGPEINIGIPKNLLPGFNGAVNGVRILPSEN